MDHLEQLFTIQQISRKLNIPKPTLRFWEKELDGIIVPLRTPGGQRRYTIEHLNLIQKIQRMRRQGMRLNEIKTKLNNLNAGMKLPAHPLDFEVLVERVAEVVKSEIYRLLNDEMDKG
ncbi:MAG: MerR family transcriptional regulator [Desulfobacterales bacterium]|jgi:DNA-binding transcriptional MerR regulator